MAFPQIAATATTGRGAETTTPVNLPDGIQTDNLLLVFFRCAGAGAIGWPAGWTELFQDSSDATDDVTALAYRKADGSELATINVTHGNFKSAALAWRILGAADPTTQAPQAGSVTVGISIEPDPALLTPTGGAKDYLWLALAASQSGAIYTAFPPNYVESQLQVGSVGFGIASQQCRVAAAARLLNAASENPGLFALATGQGWSAWTLAIHPSPALPAIAAALNLDAPPAGIVQVLQIVAAAPASFELNSSPLVISGGPHIPASQVALAAPPVQAPVVLVKLTTFSDQLTGAVESEYYWTRGQDVLYNYQGGATRAFEGVLLRVGEVTRQMEHLPNATFLDLRRTGLELTVANEALPTGGTRWGELRTRNLLYSRVELSLLLLPVSRRLAGTPGATDLRDLSGIEHVVWFRGECLHVGVVTPTEIPLAFEAREPALDWAVCSVAADSDPRHLGLRYPVPIGKAKNVAVINRRVGWVTTLASEILTAQATGFFELSDATGIPQSATEVQIGAERVTLARVNSVAHTVQITARGISGSQAIAHKAGEQVIEILASSVFVFSGIQAVALDALYVISPLTSERIRVLTSYTIDLANTGIDSGRVLGTVTFTAAEFRAMIDAMAAISQQPTLEAPGNADSIPFQAFAIEDPFPEFNNIDAILTVSPAMLGFIPLTGPDEGGRAHWTSAAGMPNPTQIVTRFRFTIACQGLGGPLPNTRSTRLMMKFTGIYGRTSTPIEIYSFDNGLSEFGIVIQTAFFVAIGGPFTEASVVDTSGTLRNVRFWIQPGPGSGFYDLTRNIAEVLIDSCALEVELSPATLTELGIAAVSLGWGLDLLADVQGAQDAGVLLEHPADIISWFISSFAGLGISAVDAASFVVARANIGTIQRFLGGTLNDAGDTFAGVLAGLCFHARANLVAQEGPLATRYRLLAAQPAFNFPTPTRTLLDLRDQTETRREASEQATRFLGHYFRMHPAGAGGFRIEDFRSLVRIDRIQNDAPTQVATSALTAAEQRYGRRDAQALLFPLIWHENTAIDVLGYYAFESIANRGRFAFTVPFSEGYELEQGDTVFFTPQGYGSTVKARVLQVILAPGEPHVGLVCEEVT